ncbi:MAG TPA: restriction endonuclease subunit S, partial [Terriglobales bacterium]|nr:restriction endonuclease subunit S [Terriglobales bacterium]
IAEIIGGSTPSRETADYWGGSIPWVTPTDLPMPGKGIAALKDTAEKITEHGLASSSTTLLPMGAVLFSSRATIGKLAIADVPVATNQGFANFIPSPAVFNRYLAWALQFHTPNIERLAGSTTFKEVTKTALKAFRIPLPPLSEQRRIAEMLDQADRLRRLRAEADKKAERILPALFIKMFGDPILLVNVKENVPLGDLEVDFQNGFACGEKDVDGGAPHLRMNNIDDSGVLNLELIRTVPNDRNTDRYRLLERDLLFMGTNSEEKVGKTCLFLPPDDRTYLFSNHLIRLRVRDSRITPEYLAAFLHLLWSKTFFPSIAKRWVNQASVAQSSLTAVRIPLPPAEPLQVFTRAYRGLLSLRAQWTYSGKEISRIFTVLLHRAFSGQLTATWREAHMKELLAELEQQAKLLNLPPPSAERIAAEA